MKTFGLAMTLSLALMSGSAAAAQQPRQPLTNDDVITMVKSGMPESVVVSAIRSEPNNFETSASELVRLHKAGVTENELNAIMAANKTGAPHSAAAPAGETAASKSRMPKVYVVRAGASQELPLEKTHLAETKAKPSSMKSLAADSAVTQAMQAGIDTAAYGTAVHMNSAIAGASVAQAGGVFSGIMAHRQPKVTYVWGVAGPASATVLKTIVPEFRVDFSRTPGIDPDDYEPAIVKLTPAQNSCRIVGATQGNEDEGSSAAADWRIYSHFLEERVASKPDKIKSGEYKLSAGSELLPGEYAVVLRPVSKEKTFSGGDIARGQGDGLMFDALWSFQIAESAE